MVTDLAPRAPAPPPPPPPADVRRGSMPVPARGPVPLAVSGRAGSSGSGSFGHHFVHPTCFSTAPVRRRRLPLAGARSESLSASPTPPSAGVSSGSSSSRSSRSEQGRLSSSPATSVSTSAGTPPTPGAGAAYSVPPYSAGAFGTYAALAGAGAGTGMGAGAGAGGAGTPSWSATSGSLSLASFGKRSAPGAAAAPAMPVLRSGVDLTSHYRNYVRALNTRSFDLICRYTAPDMTHNGVAVGHTEFCNLIPPGAVFMPEDIIVDFPNRTIAARLYIEYPCMTGHTTVWGVYPFAPAEEERGRPEARGRRRVCQVDEMAFYRFDDEWRIESINSMIAARNPIRSGSGSDDDYRERSGSM